MLQGLSVKNFALIDELSMEFEPGLNILTGETGAGKSILLGSIQMALGAKTSKEMIRNGAPYASVEITFSGVGESVQKLLSDLQLPVEEDVILSRRITSAGKSVSRVNGETVTIQDVRELAAMLLEIHGQQEHHSLLTKDKHLFLVDRYSGEKAQSLKEKIADLYSNYKETEKTLSGALTEKDNKNRDCSYLEYALNEIRNAVYRPGEEEELAEKFQKLSHAKALMDGVSAALSVMCEGNQDTVDDLVNQAIRSLSKISSYDRETEKLLSSAEEISELISDFHREASSYLESLEGFEEEYETVSERLNLFHQLKAKYGKTMNDVLLYANECEEKLNRYADYDGYLASLQKKLQEQKIKLTSFSEDLSLIRKKTSEILKESVCKALSDLNFLEVRFEIRFERTDFAANGYDSVEFYIATNPGEELKPLIKTASGGELSRIMLALKSVFADREEIETMIFDEIDTGISGKTAQLVSEKMAQISKNRQLLCITHLPQIASMADNHFYIEKTTDGERTVTKICKLSEEEEITELARMLGGASITETVRKNAAEMKKLAIQWKKTLLH